MREDLSARSVNRMRALRCDATTNSWLYSPGQRMRPDRPDTTARGRRPARAAPVLFQSGKWGKFPPAVRPRPASSVARARRLESKTMAMRTKASDTASAIYREGRELLTSSEERARAKDQVSKSIRKNPQRTGGERSGGTSLPPKSFTSARKPTNGRRDISSATMRRLKLNMAQGRTGTCWTPKFGSCARKLGSETRQDD